MAVAAHDMNACVRGAVSAAVLMLAACVRSAPDGGRAARTAAPPAPVLSGGTTDGSYDWHGLLLTPFGTLLRESPIRLHEVLLFHDESHDGTADVDNKDCHAIDGAPPRFVGQLPDQYLLCFEHDRLNRIDAAVRLDGGEAEQVFARACALWLHNPAPTLGNTCEGRDNGIAFSARLALVPGEATATLSMTLSDAALPR